MILTSSGGFGPSDRYYEQQLLLYELDCEDGEMEDPEISRDLYAPKGGRS